MDIEKSSVNPEENIPTEDTALENAEPAMVEDDFSEVEIDTEVEGSTIFTKSTPAESQKKVATGKQKRIRLLAILAALVIVIVGGLLAVFYLIPEKEDESQNTSYSVKVKQVDTDDVAKIVVDNSYGELVFTSKVVANEDSDASEGETTVEWALEGYDPSLIASSSVNAAADSLATIYATREMEDLSLDYGLDTPSVTATVTMRDGSSYKVFVGDQAPDGSGYYLKVSDSEKVYLVATGSINNFDTTPEKLANAVIVSTPVLDENTKTADKKYFDEDGNLASFDSIHISGSKYGKSVTLLPLEDNEMAQFIIDMGSYTRYADTDAVTEMYGIMTNGLVAIDTYKLKPTKADISKYRLNKPEVEITLKYGSGTTKMIASMYDEEQNYYAVMIDGRDAVYAVTADALSMLELSIEDFYNQFVFLEYIYDFSKIKIETPDKTYNFALSYDEDEEELTATESGKPIDDELFSAYYQHIVTIAPTAQSEYVSGKAAYKATFTYEDTDKSTRVLELIKQTDRRYLVKVDGIEMGLVNSTIYDHLVDYVQHIMDEKGIPEP